MCKPDSKPIEVEIGSLRVPESTALYAKDQRSDAKLLNVLLSCNKPAQGCEQLHDRRSL